VSISPSPSEHSVSAPPPGEEIHLPGPSILPLICAIAITLMVIGTTLGWYLSAIGFVVFVPTVVRWVRDTRRDVAALPEHHDA
jgi:Flp pilus assembly protein TadB